MSQNIYDSDSFFEAYSRYPRAVDGLKGASEWPLLRLMLPRDLKTKVVLDLGCGDGWFSRWAADEGAAKVLGVDVSKNMIDRAFQLSQDGKYSTVSFRRVDLDALSLDHNTFDLVFSGLALHYAANLQDVMLEAHKSLKSDGLFVFSVEHPMFTAPGKPGFLKNDKTDMKSWPVSDYFQEGERTVDWLGAGVKKYHHTVSSYIKALSWAGFELVALDEWGMTSEEGRMHPDWPNEGVIPRFLLLAAKKSPPAPL